MILMVTSLWHHRTLHPRGLVPNSKGPLCQFRGDWSQPIASLTSESDFSTFAGEGTQCHLSWYSYSLDINHDSQNPRVPAMQERHTQRFNFGVAGVRVHYYFLLLAVSQFPFVSRQWLLWRKVTNGKCGSSFVYSYSGQFNWKRISVFCRSVAL